MTDERILELWGESFWHGETLADKALHFARALLSASIADRSFISPLDGRRIDPDALDAKYRVSASIADTAGARIERLRKGLFEARDAMRVMSNWSKKSDPAGYGWAVRMVNRANAVLNHEPVADATEKSE